MSDDLSSIEKTNLKMQLVHRSLYILKRKFEIHKEQINQIYYDFKQKEIKNPLLSFSINNFPEILNNIMSICHFLILPCKQYSELITADLMTDYNYQRTQNLIQLLTQYSKDNIQKYNLIFYKKKIKEIKLQKELLEKNPDLKDEIIEKEIKLYDKRGKLIKNKEEIDSNNVELDLEEEPNIIEENDIDILYSDKFLYSQTIPLIIADFVQNNLNTGIVSIDDELNNEIRNLFDNTIIESISKLEQIDPLEEKKRDIKNILFEEMNLEHQLRNYENILIEKKRNKENTKIVLEMIHKLKYQKASLHQKLNYLKKEAAMYDLSFNENEFNLFETNNNNKFNIKINKNSSKKKLLTKEEKRYNSLKEIFYFYTKQHKIDGKGATFDSYITNKENMDLAEFSKFSDDFKLMTKKGILSEIFKNNSKNRKNISFKEFLICLEQIAQAMNEYKIEYAQNEKNKYMKQLTEIDDNEKYNKLSVINEEQSDLYTNTIGVKDDNQSINSQIPNEIPVEKENENEEKKEEKKNENNNDENNDNNNNENKENNNNENNDNNTSDNNNNNNNSKNKVVKKPKSKFKKKNDNMSLYSKSELVEKINILDQDIEDLHNKTNEKMTQELYEYIEIDKPNEFRKKMIGFIVPFNIHYKPRFEKYPNFIKKKDFEEISEIQKIIRKNKLEMDKEEKLNQQIQRKNEYENKIKKFKEDNKNLQKKMKDQMKGGKKYMQILKSQQDYKKEQENKITWEELINYDYDHFILNDQENKSTTNSVKRDIHNNTINNIFNQDTIDEEDIGIFPNKNKVNTNNKNLSIINSVNSSLNYTNSNKNLNTNKNLNANFSGSNIYKSSYLKNNYNNNVFNSRELFTSNENMNINNNKKINYEESQNQVYNKKINKKKNNKRYESNIFKNAGNNIITNQNMMKEGFKRNQNYRKDFEKSFEKMEKMKIQDEVNLIQKIERNNKSARKKI